MQEKITGKMIPETAGRTARGTALKMLPETAPGTATEIKHQTSMTQKKTESLTDIDGIRKTEDERIKKNMQECQI